MKRFLLFTFESYSKDGGANDFVDSYDTLEGAKGIGDYQIAKGYAQDYNIIDTLTGEIHK